MDKKSSFSVYLKGAWLLGFAIFFVLMLRITLQYIPFDSKAAFLILKQAEVEALPPYLFLFYLHVCSSIFVLPAGFTQFNRSLLRNRPAMHRKVGKLYAYTVLFVAAPSGIYIGLHANGGFLSQLSFVTLGLLWFTFTYRGIAGIRKKKWKEHEKMMLRSFALAFSAITLRLWKVILVGIFEPNPMDVYRIVAWLGWVPNIIAIEWFLSKKYPK